MIDLRPYQVESIEKVRAAIRRVTQCNKTDGIERGARIMLTIPTGGGKTYTSASVIIGAFQKGKRCLFVAHRLELIDQTVRAFARLGITAVGVIRAGDKRRDSSQPIQVASIQTLARRKQEDVDLIIIDEAHRASSASYTTHLFDRHPNAIIIGLSATPCRADGKPLGTHFDELVVGASYSELIAGGSIVAPHVYTTPMVPDMSTVRTSAGDYNQDDLEAAMNRGALIGDLLAQWLKHPRQRTVAFAVSIAHSRAIVSLFSGAGVRAEHLDGNTPEEERRAILGRLASGETELVSNVGVLCEGWDLPSCKTLILARPTKSLGLYMQMAGRILRPWWEPCKLHDDCKENEDLAKACAASRMSVTPLVLDHGGNVDRHGLPHEDREWSLTSKAKKRAGAPLVKSCPECFAYVAASAKACPHCDFAFPETTKDPEAVEPVIVDLELRTLAAEHSDDKRMQMFRRFVSDCRKKGWKFGAAVHQFERTYKEPPPREWIEALKKDFRRDQEWKDRVRLKQQAREEAA